MDDNLIVAVVVIIWGCFLVASVHGIIVKPRQVAGERAHLAAHPRRAFWLTWCWQTLWRSLVLALLLVPAVISLLPWCVHEQLVRQSYNAEAIPVIGNLRVKIELYRIEKGRLPGLGLSAEDTYISTSQLADGQSRVQTFSEKNMAVFEGGGGDKVLVVTNSNHVFPALDFNYADATGRRLQPKHLQYRVDACEKGEKYLYALGAFGDGDGLMDGTGYAVLEFNDPAANSKGVATWERYEPVCKERRQVVMVNAVEAQKYFKCETPEQAMQMNLCWVGDTEALMSGDLARGEKALEELRRAGWSCKMRTEGAFWRGVAEPLCVSRSSDVEAGSGQGLNVSADFSHFPDGKPVLYGVDNICVRGVDKNPRYKESARFIDRGSCLQGVFEVKRLPAAARLSVTHLSSASPNARNGGWSPVTILINDHVVVKDHSPSSHGYMTESWRVEPFLKKGRNTITFRQGELETHYWLQGFRITEGDKPDVPANTKRAHRPVASPLFVYTVILVGLIVWFAAWAGRRKARAHGTAAVRAGSEITDDTVRLPDGPTCEAPCNKLSPHPDLTAEQAPSIPAVETKRTKKGCGCLGMLAVAVLVAFVGGVAVLLFYEPFLNSARYTASAVNCIEMLRTHVETFRTKNGHLPGLGGDVCQTKGNTSQLAAGLSRVQTFSGTNAAAFTSDFKDIAVVATPNHFSKLLGICGDDLFGPNSFPRYFQYRVDGDDERRERRLYTIGAFGDGNRANLYLGSGYAVLEYSDPAAQSRGVATWQRYKPLNGQNRQIVMVNAEEARKVFKCETPEQATTMNLCWVGDTEALMSGDRARVEKALAELRKAGWE